MLRILRSLFLLALWLVAGYLLFNWWDYQPAQFRFAPTYKQTIAAEMSWFIHHLLTLQPPWVCSALPIGAFMTLMGRLRWRSYSISRTIAWVPICVLLTCFLLNIDSIRFPENIQLSEQLFLLAILIGVLALPAFLLGCGLGSLAALPLVFLVRLITRDIGFCSHPLSFVWHRGADHIRVRCSSPGLRPRKTVLVALADFSITTSVETEDRWHVPTTTSTSTGMTASGDYVVLSTTTHDHGRAFSYTAQTWRTKISIGGVGYQPEILLGPVAGLEAKFNASRLRPHWIKARDKLREHQAAEKIRLEKQQAAEREELELAEKQRKAVLAASVDNHFNALANKAGLRQGYWRYYTYSEAPGGNAQVMQALAADRESTGLAVFEMGRQQWMGSWKGAKLQELANCLDIQVVDPEYRDRNMCDRRFTIGEGWPLRVRQEWASRIQLLSKHE